VIGSRQWILARRPRGPVQAGDFALREEAVFEPGEGEAVAATRWLSFEPAMRGWLDDAPDRWGRTAGVAAPGYGVTVDVGEVVKGPAVAEVVASRRPDLHPGDLVRGLFGWREHVSLGTGAGFQRLDPSVPVPVALGVLGGTGLTAYMGIVSVGSAVAGETVVVSGAAGAVGSVAGQIARIRGCRVIGIAGGAEKRRWLLEACRFDEVVDYKAEDVAVRLRQLCPDSIDVYFDNVGGPALEAAIANMAVHGRIVLCGLVSSYDSARDGTSPGGPGNLFHLIARRVSMQGYLLSDYADRLPEAAAWLRDREAAGELAHREDIAEGFEQAPAAFLRLFSGANQGKQLLRL
jgi:NADPH-dependent curcumin reductase